MMSSSKRVSACGCYRSSKLLVQPEIFLAKRITKFLILFDASIFSIKKNDVSSGYQKNHFKTQAIVSYKTISSVRKRAYFFLHFLSSHKCTKSSFDSI